jgi:hypothetical protein
MSESHYVRTQAPPGLVHQLTPTFSRALLPHVGEYGVRLGEEQHPGLAQEPWRENYGPGVGK